MISVALSPAANAAAVTSACWRADEARASRMQALQTMLMVDAIKCQDTIPETLASYNAFMKTRHDAIIANKYMVQAYFVRTLGPVDGAKAFTDNDTLVANRLSSDGIDVRRCEASGMYARAAAQATEEDLLTMATILTKDANVIECPVQTVVTARPTTMVIPVWKKPTQTVGLDIAAPQPAVQTDATPSIADAGNSGLSKAGPSSAMASSPAADPVAGVAPASNQAETLKALQAAVAALTQVASALVPTASVASGEEN